MAEDETSNAAEPWREHRAWAGGVVKGAAKTEAIWMTLMGVAFVGLSLPAALALPEELRRGNYAILVVLLFPLVGLGLGWVAARRWRQVLRFGQLRLVLDPFPGSWGGQVGGTVEIPRGAWVEGNIEVGLRCARVTVTGSGKNRRQREKVLWETDWAIDPVALGGMGLVKELPVQRVVPRGSGEITQLRENNSGVRWTLKLEAPLRGGGTPLQTQFEIPVYDRGEDLPADAGMDAAAKDRREAQRQGALAEAGVVRRMELGQELWSFHQPKAKRQSWGLVLFILIFAAVAWWVPVWFMQVIFGGFALLLLAFLPGILWHRSELRLGKGEVELRRRSWRGWRSWRLRADEIDRLELKESMQAGETRYLRLKAIGVPGIDPEKPHAAEHFKARKARYRWQRESRGGQDPSEATYKALLETPCFEIELAGYLKGTRAADDVKSLLEEALRKQ